MIWPYWLVFRVNKNAIKHLLLLKYLGSNTNCQLKDIIDGNITFNDRFTGLKTANPSLKTLLAVGGWNEGATVFSDMVRFN